MRLKVRGLTSFCGRGWPPEGLPTPVGLLATGCDGPAVGVTPFAALGVLVLVAFDGPPNNEQALISTLTAIKLSRICRGKRENDVFFSLMLGYLSYHIWSGAIDCARIGMGAR